MGVSHIVQAATGFGKTYCAMSIIAQMGLRTAVATTKEDIIEQWVVAAKEVLNLSAEEIGVWRGDQVPSPRHKIVIGLVQSMSKGYARYGQPAYSGFPLVICDEVHRMGAEQFSQMMWYFNGPHRLGLSATPYRKDGRDVVFRAHIGEIKVVGKVETLIPKILTKQTGWRVPRGANGKMIPHKAGKVGHIVKKMAANPQRNLVLIEFVVAAHKRDRNNIVFSDSLEHLSVLHQMARDHGVPEEDIGFYVGLQSYTGTKEERKAKREKAKAAKVIFATYKMASEATDIPWLDACVLGTPRSDVNQIVGRIRREYGDNIQPVVFDPVDGGSPVFAKYAKSRFRWYNQIGAEVVQY
jgi:superfamily II DNA or RNA helicase